MCIYLKLWALYTIINIILNRMSRHYIGVEKIPQNRKKNEVRQVVKVTMLLKTIGNYTSTPNFKVMTQESALKIY